MSYIARYLAQANPIKASDIHICEARPVRARVDGEIVILEDNAPDIKNIFDELIDFNPPNVKKDLLASLEDRNDICFTFESAPHKLRLRVTVYKDEIGLCIAIRLIPFNPYSIDELGLPDFAQEVCKLNRGLFVVTGASGSGKSTTLAAMVDHMNKTRKAHIITIEDPIEFVIKSDKCLVNSREVGRDTQSFATGIHWILREDPNVVVLGELRDIASMRAAIQIAETGHFVLATLHTRSAVSTIDRFIGSFPPDDQHQMRMMLADNLVGILAQTLIPRRSGGGMIGAYELLINNDAMKNNIREQKIYQIENILQTGQSQGMMSMEDYIIHLIKQEFVDYEKAMQYAPSRRKLQEKYDRMMLM